AAAAIAPLAGAAPGLVLVFGTAGYDQAQLLAGVREVTGGAPMAGCSAAGVITQAGSDEGSRVVAVMALASDRIQFDTLVAAEVSADPEGRGASLARHLAALGRQRPRQLLLFTDGITVNATALIRGLEGELEAPIRMAGGSAGELHRFERTYQYHDGEVYSDAAVAVLLSGDLTCEALVTHGSEPIGVEHAITRAEGGTVYEIDGRPAWQVLREYLDDSSGGLEATNVSALCVAQRAPDGDLLIRVPVGLDPDSGAMFFAGELLAGQRVIMVRRDTDHVSENAIAAARRLASTRGEKPALVLQFDCVGRGRLLFGEQVGEKVIDPVQQAIGKDVPWLGMHSYGEIGQRGERACFHNYTMVLLALYDGDGAA
ncbi:MAG TPA: FIST N-terminal domain-containing protein, partial [Kofleriaceae bacterium]|nr:FIST N-terminal domain-containing protein [Kofleriaceae bacterium]